MRIKEFYDFITERESIRLRRLAGLPREQWTQDPVFQQFSFTNVKRIHDRTTTILMREFYSRDLEQHTITPHEQSLGMCRASLLNCTLFRYFGTVESARMIGWLPEWDENQKRRIQNMGVMDDLRFTAAYIVPNCGSSAPKYEIVTEIVDLVWKNSEYILDCNTWMEMCIRLCENWGVGPFMAKEILLDYILCTGWTPSDWTTWTPVGPGGKRGASRIAYGGLVNISDYEALAVIKEVYEARATYWPPKPLYLPWSHVSPNCDNHCGCSDGSVVSTTVELDLTDIQFQCCEFDKYCRVAEGRRPKRTFRPTVDDVTCG